MESVQKQGSSAHYGLEKYNALIGMDCCCFFEYDKKTDKLSFSNNMVIPELSGKVIEHCTFQISNIIVDQDVPLFIDFLHYAKEHPIEFRIKGHVQNVIWCRAHGIAIRDEHDDVVTVIGYIDDIIARVGGNEFLLFLKNIKTTSELLERPEAIRKIIQETYVGEQVEWKVSCNIGISLFPEHGTRYTELFTKAGKALYDSNQLSFYLLKLRNSERITEQMEMAKDYDSVTGLPTIHKFVQDTKILCNTFQDTKFAIVYLDIKNFKFINDFLGYDKGDLLLKDLAQCLRNASVGKQISTRTGADNFITLIPYEDKDELKKRVLDEIDTFIDMQNRKNISCNIGISAGIYMLKEDDKDIMSAIDNANMARKLVKNSTVDQCIFYDDEMEQKIRKEQMIIRSMHSALENEEFQVYLQPKINLETSKIGGAEALVRWRRSDGSMIPPNDFIPLFEKNGFVVNLDFYIYEQVCKILRRWKEKGQEIVPISVNVSRVHLYHDDFLDKVLELIGKYEIEPWMMEFELTESIFLNNTVTAITVMKELRKLGFCVSIDDFGAGYSSLNLLKDMRTDVLKLDKEFFRTGEMKEEERIIVSSIIKMAKQLNMKVLSEGVETQMQSDFLKKVECDMAQGYLYARPLPVYDFEVLLDSYNSNNFNNSNNK